MTSRKQLLIDIVNYNRDITKLLVELRKYPWDWDIDEPLVVMDKKDVCRVLRRVEKGEISKVELENWANAIECREDIDYHSNELQEVIVELANPELFGGITISRIKELIENLSGSPHE